LWRQLQPMLASEWADWLPVYAWAIVHSEGVIVVDTGANAGLKSLPRWHPYFRSAVRFDIEPEQELGPQLQSHGIGARDVRTVVLTHLHIDHDGGLAHFPYARILVSADELARASGWRGTILGYLPNRWPQWFEPAALVWQPAPLGPFSRSARITKAGDVIAVPTPGHTPGHVSVIVTDAEQRIVLAGDASYLESTMLNGTLDGVSPNETAALRTLASIRALSAQGPTIYLPTHDPQSAHRLRGRRAVTIAGRGQSPTAPSARPAGPAGWHQAALPIGIDGKARRSHPAV